MTQKGSNISEALRRAKQDKMTIEDNLEEPGYAKILSFPYRRTGMGGFDDTILISLRTRRPIKSALRTSRSGNHGNRAYRLFPARYIAYEVSRSNAGNLYANVAIITLQEDGQVKTEKEWQICRGHEQLLDLDHLPKEIREILIANKDELPLFQYVFPFSFNEEEERAK